MYKHHFSHHHSGHPPPSKPRRLLLGAWTSAPGRAGPFRFRAFHAQSRDRVVALQRPPFDALRAPLNGLENFLLSHRFVCLSIACDTTEFQSEQRQRREQGMEARNFPAL